MAMGFIQVMPPATRGRTVLQKYVPLSDAGMEKSLSLSDELIRTSAEAV